MGVKQIFYPLNMFSLSKENTVKILPECSKMALFAVQIKKNSGGTLPHLAKEAPTFCGQVVVCHGKQNPTFS